MGVGEGVNVGVGVSVGAGVAVTYAFTTWVTFVVTRIGSACPQALSSARKARRATVLIEVDLCITIIVIRVMTALGSIVHFND